MKKKILFMTINMNVGGTEKALLNMMAQIPKDQYDITLLMLERHGDFLNSIPDNIQVECIEEYKEIKQLLNIPPLKTAFNAVRERQFLKAINLVSLHAASKILKDRSIFYKSLLKKVAEVKKEYDLAVAYAGPMDFISYFVVQRIKAKKKVQWIHFDVTKIGFNKVFASKTYARFDKIFVVSNEGKNKLIDLVPSIENKTETFRNILSKETVNKMADQGEGFDDDFNGIRILTVGRLSKEKGQDLIIPVLAKLKTEGYKVRWYSIGDGSARNALEALITAAEVENDFILLGAKSNPYPFMKQCDIYVQPSRHEGYCITLAEARCFDSPIISTDFTGAREQIKNNMNGLIVPFDELQMFKAVKRLLDEEQIRGEIRRNLQEEVVDTINEIEKLYSLANV